MGQATLALVLAVLGVGTLLSLTVSSYRRGASFQAASLEAREALRAVAEAALEAAAAPGRAAALLEDPAEADAFLQALRDGALVSGLLVPEDPGLVVEAAEVAPTEPGWALSPVRYRPLEYRPAANLGVLCFQVDVTRAGRHATFAHRYEFSLRDRAGGGLEVLLADAPLERIHP